MIRNLFWQLILVFCVSPAFGFEALVYSGPGSCPEDCSKAAGEMATLAGATHVTFVGPEEKDPQIFENARIWIQPGGKSSLASKTMAPELKQNIREFVRRGGGYVGFCAGGFFATSEIADRKVEGLGILPGRNALYELKDEFKMIPVSTPKGVYSWYWEGGPYFIPPQKLMSDSSQYEVMATYPTGEAASVRAHFGTGRVYVTGLHPEAPQWWRDDGHIVDEDGLDFEFAVDMIRWSAQLDESESQ